MKRERKISPEYVCPREVGQRLISYLRSADDWDRDVNFYNVQSQLQALMQGPGRKTMHLDLVLPGADIREDLWLAEKVMGWQGYTERESQRWPYFYSYTTEEWKGRVIVFAAGQMVGSMFSPSSDPLSCFIMEEALRERGLGPAYEQALSDLGLVALEDGVGDLATWTMGLVNSLTLRIKAAERVLGIGAAGSV